MQSCTYAYIIFYAHAQVCVVPKTIHTSPTEEIFPYTPPPPLPPPPHTLGNLGNFQSLPWGEYGYFSGTTQFWSHSSESWIGTGYTFTISLDKCYCNHCVTQ